MTLSSTPQTSEIEICGHTETHGGEYEWTCVRRPHSDGHHKMRAFSREENTQ